MGQLIIKYKMKNLETNELIKNVDLTQDEDKKISDQSIKDFILDGEVFLQKDQSKARGDKNERLGDGRFY